MLISKESADLIVTEICAIVELDVFLTDITGEVISSTLPIAMGTVHKGAQQVVQELLPHIIYNNEGDLFHDVTVCQPIILQDRIVGVIGVMLNKGAVEQFMENRASIVRRMAEIRIRRLSRRLSEGELQFFSNWARQVFFESILFSDTLSKYFDVSEMEFRAGLLGVDLMHPRIIVILGFRKNDPNDPAPDTSDLPDDKIQVFANFLLQHICNQPQDFCFVHKQQIIILFCANSSNAIYQDLCKVCQSLEAFYPVRVYAGISSPSANVMEMQSRYTEAHIACQVAKSSAYQPIQVYDITSIEFIAHSLSPRMKQALVRHVFANVPPEELDDITTVINVYVNQAGRVDYTADALFMHRNSVLYRMRKIKSLTGYNIRKPKDLITLYLATLMRG